MDTIHQQHARLRIWKSSMGTTAAPDDSGLVEPAPQTRLRPHRYLLLPRLERGSRVFFPGPLLSVLVQYRYWYWRSLLPWLTHRRRVLVPVKRNKLCQKRPTFEPQGLQSVRCLVALPGDTKTIPPRTTPRYHARPLSSG